MLFLARSYESESLISQKAANLSEIFRVSPIFFIFLNIYFNSTRKIILANYLLYFLCVENILRKVSLIYKRNN